MGLAWPFSRLPFCELPASSCRRQGQAQSHAICPPPPVTLGKLQHAFIYEPWSKFLTRELHWDYVVSLLKAAYLSFDHGSDRYVCMHIHNPSYTIHRAGADRIRQAARTSRPIGIIRSHRSLPLREVPQYSPNISSNTSPGDQHGLRTLGRRSAERAAWQRPEGGGSHGKRCSFLRVFRWDLGSFCKRFFWVYSLSERLFRVS